ncbi:A nuclease family of the HNH/ENDO VII superfamily with conserved AHH [Lihuaxuella thermophila]|uniref:A nuclease family of the HNH/ENDO VII superfamily with conserved AHH n=2 Tax=Lihuaxuella thermophila TaxID=1173111 RepID=A0A1H8AD74_9BACL|nr:A nuclease family of the HNH/ENDO VII superfamily with conserved AHH [Lihuaxuella thermophila]
MVLAAGALLASLLLVAVTDAQVKEELKEKVVQALSGNAGQVDAPKESEPPSPTDPKIETPPTSNSNTPNYTQTHIVDDTGEKKDGGGFVGWLKEKGNGVLNWLGKQKDQIWNDDLKRAYNDPLGYLSDVIGAEDIKYTWNKMTSDPLGYLKDSWNNAKEQFKAIADNPWTLLFDQEQFMEGLNGKDKDGKSIPIANRVYKIAESLPLPTKLLKIGTIGKNILVHKGCTCEIADNTSSQGGGAGTKASGRDGAKVYTAQGYVALVSNRTQLVGHYKEGTQASIILRNELKLAGVEPPPYPNAAHHIVPWNDRRARRAQQLLEQFGIDPNSAANGVYLPCKKKDCNKPETTYIGDETPHIGNHGLEYIEYVTEKLEEVKVNGGTTLDAVKVLNNIRGKLLNGSLSLN